MATVPVQAPDEEREHPESWIWGEDGDHVAGRFVRFDRASTRDYGSKAILVLDVDGTERSIWLLHDALYARVRDEVAERPKRNLDANERVVIFRLDEKESANGRRYRAFRVLFPDRPELSAADVFELDKPTPVEDRAEPAEPEEPAGDQDDGIPF